MWNENNWHPGMPIHRVKTVIIYGGTVETQSITADVPGLERILSTHIGPTQEHRGYEYRAPVGARVVVETHRASGPNLYKQYLIVDAD
jgi:hypothetical protein